MIKKRFPILVLFVLLQVSCIKTNEKENKLPNSNLIKGYDVKSEDIFYQFYEEFGFDEVCIHNRAYFKIENFKLDNNWKKLPISKNDLSKLKLIPNKIDTLEGNSLRIKYSHKLFFDDISLVRKEFISENSFDNILGLSEGYYKIENSNSFMIYTKKNMIYYEEHYCSD